jgi:hypothetical protein
MLQHFGYAVPFFLAAGLCVGDAVLRIAFVGRHPRAMADAEPAAGWFGYTAELPPAPEPRAPAEVVEETALLSATSTPFQSLHGRVLLDEATLAIPPPDFGGGDGLDVESRPASAKPDPPADAAAAGDAPAAEEEEDAAAETLSVVKQLVGFLRQPDCLLLILMTFTSGFTITALEIAYPLNMSRVWNATSEQIGIVFGVLDVTYAVFSVVGGFLSDRLRRRALVLSVGSLVYGGSMFLVGFSGSFTLCLVVSVRLSAGRPSGGSCAAQVGVGVAAGVGTAGTMPLISEAAAAAGTGSGLAFSVWNAVRAARP